MREKILKQSVGILLLAITNLQGSEASGKCVKFRDSFKRECRVSCEFDWQNDRLDYASEGSKLNSHDDCTGTRRWETKCDWDQLSCRDKDGSKIQFNFWSTFPNEREAGDEMSRAQCQYRPSVNAGECMINCDTDFDPSCNAFQRSRHQKVDPSKCKAPIGWETECDKKGCLDEDGNYFGLPLGRRRVNPICFGVNCGCIPD